MTAVERFIAKVGWTGALMLALALSVGLNAWQLYRSGGSSSRCEEKQATAAVAVHEAADERDNDSLTVAAETKEQAEAEVAEVQAESTERKETIRVVYRELPPADPVCPIALPERVHDTLGDAADAANRADL